MLLHATDVLSCALHAPLVGDLVSLPQAVVEFFLAASLVHGEWDVVEQRPERRGQGKGGGGPRGGRVAESRGGACTEVAPWFFEK